MKHLSNVSNNTPQMGCLSSKTDSSDQKSRATLTTDGQSTVPKLDSRLPFQQYRDFFQLKNYWKAVRRREDASKCLFFRFLTENAEFHPLYKKLSKVELTEEAAFNSNEFENIANQYLDVFDEAISAIESSPGDVSTAIDELMEVGRKHKAVPNMDASNFSKLESALLYMVQQILLDRFNEKCEDLFKKFFSFVVTNVTKGFNE
ncbi:Neuroglobin [Trichinella pseudospiralis]|uniref:Neuroglobin n=1 Tax=Trichinella pseudospiralis TaxID=6337 RepID=A0A0V1E528_TRIPS|nr:Neuroglobin [Trichinella pseudospiralis]KRZ32487.1 Neuroglobin [Trichinella pseudospiralis]